MAKRVCIGVVTSAKVPMTRRVEIPMLVRHAKYGKIQHRKTVCHVHDENNESALGDTVEIIESRPISKLKRWRLVRVVEKNRGVDLHVLRASAKVKQDSGIPT